MYYLIFSLIIAIYLLNNLFLTDKFIGQIEIYMLQPILWIFLSITTIYIAKHEQLNIWNFKKISRWKRVHSPFILALFVGGFHIFLLISVGLFLGFGKSPYSHNLIGIITNFLFIGSPLVAIEISRAYLIKKATSSVKNITFIIGLIAIFFMLINLRLTQIVQLNFYDPVIVIQFLGVTLIPLLATNLLASYFAYLGGALTSIGYIGIIKGFEWFSPVLPDLDWALITLIGIIGPAIGFLIIQRNIQITQENVFKVKKRTKRFKDPALSWIAISLVSVLLIFFSFGFLCVQPTVIYGSSMQPSIDVGDIAIVLEVPIDTIRKGDVIKYKTENANVIHRIHEIFEEGNTRIFITKGDANIAPDNTHISSEQVLGKVVFNLPELGWIPIYFKSILKKFGFTM